MKYVAAPVCVYTRQAHHAQPNRLVECEERRQESPLAGWFSGCLLSVVLFSDPPSLTAGSLVLLTPGFGELKERGSLPAHV